MFYIYILYSKKDKKLYTGFADDLGKRIIKHQKGFVRSTKNRRPLILIHYEAFIHERDAKQREIFLKSGYGKREIAVLLSHYFLKNNWNK